MEPEHMEDYVIESQQHTFYRLGDIKPASLYTDYYYDCFVLVFYYGPDLFSIQLRRHNLMRGYRQFDLLGYLQNMITPDAYENAVKNAEKIKHER
jgi:hypothetical protein